MMRLASATQTSQMYTRGPATSFDTWVESFRQNEHFSLLSLNITLTPCTFQTSKRLDSRLTVQAQQPTLQFWMALWIATYSLRAPLPV